MDERLTQAASLFPVVRIGADIGANHGMLACHLLKAGIAQKMWITDLSSDALEQARQNVKASGLASRAEFAVGDGFSAMTEPADAAAILGMGGATFAAILKSAPQELLPKYLVVSCHTEQETARRAICERGFEIVQERVCFSGGRYYVLHQAVRSKDAVIPDERTLFIGPCLGREHSQVYRDYLTRRLAAYSPSRSAEGMKRCQWLREEADRAAADSKSSL